MKYDKKMSLKVSHQPAKFEGNRLFGSEDIMVLVSFVILEDHVIKDSCGCARALQRKSPSN